MEKLKDMVTVCLLVVLHIQVGTCDEILLTFYGLHKGQFHRGEFHGQGIYQSSDGLVYEGDWEYNKREGKS